MSCDISHGRLETCKDSVSGLDAIYFINYGIAPEDVTTDVDNVVTAVTGVSNLYKYELKGANSFEQTIQTSRDNGTCLLYTSPSPRDRQKSRMPSSA